MRRLKSMRFGLMIFALFLVFLLALSSVAASKSSSANVNVNVNFNTSDLSFNKFGIYDIVKLRGCELKRDVGEPALPMKSIYLVIPAEAKVRDIEILSAEKIEIEGEYNIFPAQPPAPVSTFTYQNETEFTVQRASVYSASDMYPGDIFRYTGEGSLRGHKIVSITLFPVQYVPAEKKLIFYKDVTLCINYNLTPDGATAIATEKSEFTSIAKKTVSNPDDVDRFAFTYPTKKKHFSPSQKGYGVSSNDVKYVIITNDAMKDAFQPLADWKTKKGVPAEIVTVSSIEANYTGIDTQERIRNFINDTRMNRSTEWVLLGGDTDVVPHRGGYGYVLLDPPEEDTDMPADLYYSDLDGNWNADGDSIYGEVTDDIDLYPDVFVGRASVNMIAEAQTFVNKTLTYEKNPPMDYELDMLFLTEKLWSNPVTWGGDTKNIIDTGTIPPKYDPITKKYEKYGTASRQIAINEMNAGPHIVNHVGHGNFGGFSVKEWVSSGDAYSLSNSPKNFILYTISCMSNGFDHDSVSEHFMNNPNGGTVAYIGNSRYGFFIPGYPGGGPSDKYDQEFFNSLFNDNFYHVGETVADSKIAYIGQSQQDGNAMRWLQYAINLLGDPELPIWTETPRNFTINKPSEITANITQEIVIQILNDTPVQNATVCIMKSDDGIYNVSATDASGNVSFSISPTVGALNVTVTKHNFIPNESTILVMNGETSPTVEITDPEDGHWFDSEDVVITFYPWDNKDQELNYSVYVDDVEVDNGTASNCTEKIVNLGELLECDHVIRVNVTDEVGFEDSDEITIHVDLTPPIVDILSPEEGVIYRTAYIRLNFTAEDTGICPSGIAEIYYVLDGGDPVTIPEPGNATISDVGPCEHTVVVYVKDKAGKENSSSAVSLTAHPGDINGDSVVDVRDLQRLAWAFNSQPGYPNWNEDADLNRDNKLNVCDLQILAWNFGNDYTVIC